MPSNHSKALMGGGRAVRGPSRGANGGGGGRAKPAGHFGTSDPQRPNKVSPAGDSSSNLLSCRGDADGAATATTSAPLTPSVKNAKKKKKRSGANAEVNNNYKSADKYEPPAPQSSAARGGDAGFQPSLSRGDHTPRPTSATELQLQPKPCLAVARGRPEPLLSLTRSISLTTSSLSPDAKPFVMTARPDSSASASSFTGLLQAKKVGDGRGRLPAESATRPSTEAEMKVPSRQAEAALAPRKVLLQPEKPVKHPLESSWTLWYFANDSTKEWEDNLRQVSTFQFVEDFWALYHHITAVSELRSGCDYSLFRSGIKPMWEDASNVDGGRWLLNQGKQVRREVLEARWLDTLMFLVGNHYECATSAPATSSDSVSARVNGAVVSIRTKLDKIGLWLNLCDAAKVREVGACFKRYLNLHEPIVFETHKDTMQKTGSTSKATCRL